VLHPVEHAIQCHFLRRNRQVVGGEQLLHDGLRKEQQVAVVERLEVGEHHLQLTLPRFSKLSVHGISMHAIAAAEHGCLQLE
jgi:hypothetical protein